MKHDHGTNSEAARPTASFSDLDIGSIARSIYRRGGLVARAIQHHRHRIAPLEQVIGAVPRGGSVLDVGCGGGLLLNCLAIRGLIRSGHGFDSSPAAIDAARAAAEELRAIGAPVAPTFELRPVEAGFPDQEYEVVCLIDVMHHIPVEAQRTAFLGAASRTAPGGTFIYKDMCDAPAWRATMNRLHDLAMARQWIHYVPVETADAWAAESGLERITAASYNMLWYGHELRVYRRPGGRA